jgi:hypothetical protein
VSRNDCIHILRNPWGFSRLQQREAALYACDEIERLEDSYANMRAWAESNGLDTVCTGTLKEPKDG